MTTPPDRIRACGGLAAYVRDLERRIEQYEKTVTPAEYTAKENQALRQRVRDLEAARVRAEGDYKAWQDAHAEAVKRPGAHAACWAPRGAVAPATKRRSLLLSLWR